MPENPESIGSVTERKLLDLVQRSLQERLPDSWAVKMSAVPPKRGSAFDSVFTLFSPGGSAKIAVDAKRIVQPRDVPRISRVLGPAAGDGSWDIGLVAARYLSPSTRKKLVAEGLSYVDATGNIYVRSDVPPLFLADRGLDKDPWRGPGRPRGTLKGAPAAQVVRTLIDQPGPWRVREFIEAAQTSTGSVYRVIDFLESEDLLVRGQDGTLNVPDWAAMLRRWSTDYGFLTANSVSRWFAPRGVDSVIRAARHTDPDTYVITGSAAAETWAAYAPARSVMAYATNLTEIIKRWDLRPTDTGANVLIAEPAFPAITRGARRRADGLRVAAPAQVAVDLLTGPGRAPSEAEELIDWMVANERKWR